MEDKYPIGKVVKVTGPRGEKNLEATITGYKTLDPLIVVKLTTPVVVSERDSYGGELNIRKIDTLELEPRQITGGRRKTHTRKHARVSRKTRRRHM